MKNMVSENNYVLRIYKTAIGKQQLRQPVSSKEISQAFYVEVSYNFCPSSDSARSLIILKQELRGKVQEETRIERSREAIRNKHEKNTK